MEGKRSDDSQDEGESEEEGERREIEEEEEAAHRSTLAEEENKSNVCLPERETRPAGLRRGARIAAVAFCYWRAKRTRLNKSGRI